MSKFKIDINDPVITKKGIEATIGFYQTMAIDKLTLPGLSVFVTGIDSPFLNVVIDTRENTENTSVIIIAIENFFKKYDFPWSWFITPAVKAVNLEPFGYSLVEEVPGMYFNLENPLPKMTTDYIDIKELNKNDNLTDWIKPIHEGFGGKDNCEGFRQLNADLLKKGDIKLRHFIAYYKNQLAASGTLLLDTDAVMLHNLATKTAFRKLGIGSALTRFMMKEAQRLGFKHCFLDSSEDGFDLYKKLGFLTYCSTLVYSKSKHEKE